MIRQSSPASRPNRLANRKASPFSKQSLARAFRVMAPTLVALSFAAIAVLTARSCRVPWPGTATMYRSDSGTFRCSR